MSLSVGFLGLGIMGEPMARNLHKSNKFSKVVVWNRSSDKVRFVITMYELKQDYLEGRLPFNSSILPENTLYRSYVCS